MAAECGAHTLGTQCRPCLPPSTTPESRAAVSGTVASGPMWLLKSKLEFITIQSLAFRSHRLHFGCLRAVCGDRLLSKTEDISITTEGPAPHSPQNEAESADGAPQVRTEDDFAFKAIPRSRVAGTARAPGREAGPPPGKPPRPLLRTFPPRSLPEPAGLTQQ